MSKIMYEPKKRVLLVSVLMVAVLPLFAQKSATTDLSLVAATTLEAKMELVRILPIADTLSLRMVAGVSPVSFSGELDALWVPVPFLEFMAGASAGSGWNIPSLAYGLALNTDQATNDRVLERADLGGAVWAVELGGAFQFDYAALVPGDWNHIVFRTYHGWKYKSFTGAEPNEAWLYLADSGENVNGLNYYGNAFLGYQMPLVVDTVGVLVEGDLYLNDLPNRAQWGDDMVRWVMGAVLNFTFSEQLSLAGLVQLHTVRNYTAATASFGYYRKRVLDSDDPMRIEFYRVAAILDWKLE